MSTALEAQSSSIVVRRGWIAGAGVAATMSSPAKRPRDDAIDTTPTGAITLSGSDGVESPSEAKKRRATTTEPDRRHASRTTADTTQQSRNGSVGAQTGLYVMRFIAYPGGVVSQCRCGCRGTAVLQLPRWRAVLAASQVPSPLLWGGCHNPLPARPAWSRP